jgi:hypothetical protein
MYHPLWWENGSVVYSCCWPSPAQSFSGPSPAGLVTTFSCLKFETPPTWKARSLYFYPTGIGWPSYTPGTGFPFRRLLRLIILRWKYSTPPHHDILNSEPDCPSVFFITPRRRPHRKHRSFIIACIFVSSGKCLPNLCSETVVCFIACCVGRDILVLCLEVFA